MTLQKAMLGSRGVPASYSGFETCVEELGRRLDTRMKCVIAGGAPYGDEYIRRLKASARGDGRGHRVVGSSAEIFVETSGVGGTPPALTEAKALGNCVVVNDTQENLETVVDAGLSYSGARGSDDLQCVLQQLLCDRERLQTLRRMEKPAGDLTP